MNKSLDGKIKAILFDLDGTLLDVDLKKFIPQYLKGLADSVSHIIPPKEFVPYLMRASRKVERNDGRDTNENVFAESFFPLKGHSREEIQPFFDKFYINAFQKLKIYTTQKPEARLVVQTAFEQGYDVVIATTPLLPETAVRQRLDWAGVADFPYSLITAIENSHAVKPHPFYFKQIFETIGHSAEECLMVGDEDKDMLAANYGCKTFLIPGINTDLNSNTPVPSHKGTLGDLAELIKNSRLTNN